MARIAFILLCHKDPEGIVAQAEGLTAAGDYVAIHFDGRAPAADFARIRAALGGNPRVTFARRRRKGGWGEWSLVEGTLEALRAAEAAFPDASHFYMLSGDCMAIKTAEYAHAFLDAEEADYIESFDFFHSGWIKTGLREERLIYRHWFNERSQKPLFYAAMAVQRKLGLKRAVPADLEMRIGSQWWRLRRRTIEAVLEFIARRRDVVRFFRTTWIPDETFFQTLVAHLVPEAEIRTRTLTFLMFTDYGMPVTFHNDHHDLLLAQDYLFARKISPGATELKRRLGTLYAETGRRFEISGEGRRLFDYLAGRGRVGRRYAPRFWDHGGSIGAGRALLVVACKKWHVAKRFAERVRHEAGIPAIDYLFSERATPLPDLGGVESTLEKRNRHRRALLGLIFDHHRADRLVICLDPADAAALEDLRADPCELRVLEIACDFSDDYLAGHAARVGLAGGSTPPEVFARLLPTIRGDIAHESGRLRALGAPRFHRIRESAAAEDNAPAIAAFLGLPEGRACAIAETHHLFAD